MDQQTPPSTDVRDRSPGWPSVLFLAALLAAAGWLLHGAANGWTP